MDRALGFDGRFARTLLRFEFGTQGADFILVLFGSLRVAQRRV